MIFKAPKLVLLFLILTNFIFPQQNQPQHTKKVVGYYAQWAIYTRSYGVHQIEGDKLTHLMYAFYNTIYDSDTQTTRLESLDPHADFAHNNFNITYPSGTNTETERGNFGQLKMLKEKYPHLKILISLGGWTRSQHFPALSTSEKGRLTLAQSMVDLMQKYPWIGGFDIDWEFPVIGGIVGESISGNPIPDQPSTPDDHKNLVFLLKKIREVFDANGMQDKQLTIAAGNNVSRLLEGHVGPGNQASHGMTENIFDFCDFVTFFGYDFGGNWFEKACYNAPLYGGDHPKDPLNRGAGNPNQILDDLVNLYLSENGLKAPPEKLIMGIPFYGKLFERVESTGIIPELPGLYEIAPNETTSFCSNRRPPQGSWDDSQYPCEQSGSIEFGDLFQGNATNKHQYLDNTGLEVSSAAAAAGWKRYWDNTAKVPYLYNANENKFISYDDPESIDLKVKYALSQQMGGVMIWELSQDARNSNQGLLDVIDNSLLQAEYSITLNFKDVNDAPLENVMVELKDAGGTVIDGPLNSDENGQIIFSDQTAFLAYTITYTKDNLSFLPSSVAFEALEFDSNEVIDVIGSNQVSQIQGSVKENGVLLTDVDVVLKDSNDKELERILSTDGNFTFAKVINGLDYSLTVEKDYYSFTNLTYTNISTDQTNEIIEGTRNTHTIKGNIVSGTNPIDGVTVTVSGNGQDYIDNTDSSGDYVIADIPAGYNYTVTPTKSDVNFLPTNVEVNLLNENKTLNFSENVGLIYGTVKNGTTPVAGADVHLVLHDNFLTGKAYDGTNHAITNADGEYFFEETIFDGHLLFNLTLNPWQNNATTYFPALVGVSIPSTPQEFNFNSQPVTPQVTITTPSQSNVSINYGDSVSLEALVDLTYDDGSTTLSSVIFDIDGTTISNSNTDSNYTAAWSPLDLDFGTSHAFTVLAESSNGETEAATFDFTLECTGTNCPNVLPQLALVTPANTTINQNNGFEIIPITVTATDADGTVSNVSITIDGATSNMTAGANNIYTYNFTPSKHQEYPFVITAVDDESGSSTLNETLNIIDSQFVPLPDKVNVGYTHSWDAAAAPFIYLADVPTTFNVVVYAFIETVGGDGFTPVLTVYDKAPNYLTNGVFDKSKLIADIKALQDRGVPVIVSVGGQNGHVELTTPGERDIFVEGVIDIVTEYGFDGFDIDFEGSSMNFGAGALKNFDYASTAAYPRLRHVIDAVKMIDEQMGPGFHITAAPEVQYVQQGNISFLDNWGSFLPVMHNIRDILDYIHVQLYNIGETNGVRGLDGVNYFQGSPDLLVSACESLIAGFTTAGPGIKFDGLRADQVAIGLPATDTCTPDGGAAGGGYVSPEEVTKALDYLVNGKSFGGDYTLQAGPYPGFRGAMTWSVNWDKSTACDSGELEYSKNIQDFFSNALSVPENDANVAIQMFPNPATDKLTIKANQGTIASVKIFNVIGKEMHAIINPSESFDISFLPSGLYIVQLKTGEKMAYKKLVKK